MKKFLLSAIAVFAMSLCSFAQIPVCQDACAPHANDADYSTGVIPTYPTAFEPLTVGVPVDQCISIKIPSQISGSAINSALSFITLSITSITANELVNLPDGLEVCASANPMAANGTYTLRITGTPTTAGTYNLNMRAELEGGTGVGLANAYTNGTNGVSTNITIQVVEAGDMAANFSTNPSATGMYNPAVHISEGETVTFTDLSTGADHIAWSFEGGSPATSTAANVTVTYATAGTYTATLTAYNADESQSDTKSVSIEVAEASAAPVVFTVDFTADHTTIVTGQTVNFTNLTTATQNGQPYTGEIFYSWSFDADGGVAGMLATSSEANPSYSYTTAGTYSVKLAVSTSQYGVYTTADTLVKHAYITVEDDPNAVVANFTTDPETSMDIISLDFTYAVRIERGQSVRYTNTSTNADHIAWTFEGGSPATSNADTETVTYETEGTFTTKLIAYNTDETITDTLTVSVVVTNTTSVEENAISEISVYPNPTSSIVNIAAEGMQNITIIDMTGRVVMSKDVNSNFETISAEGFAKANYMVRIATADGVVVKNIVVE